MRTKCMQWVLAGAAIGLVGEWAAAAVLVEATAFQTEDPYRADVLPALSSVDGICSPSDIVPVGPVTRDCYATGLAWEFFDAISMVFHPSGPSPSQMVLRAWLQKGQYTSHNWEHYQLLPGTFNPENDQMDVEWGPPGAIDHLPGGELPDDTVVGWVEFPFDTTSSPGFLLPSGDVAMTLRLWNWRVDAVQLVPEPSVMALLALGTLSLVRRRRR